MARITRRGLLTSLMALPAVAVVPNLRKRRKFAIPCAHSRGVPVSQKVSDYQPLTRAELVYLLKEAKASYGRRDGVANSIHCRIGQAIPGTVCPSEIKGLVAETDTKVSALFVGFCRSRADVSPKLVDQFCQLLQIS